LIAAAAVPHRQVEQFFPPSGPVDRVLDEIERVCRLIGEHPEIGRERPEVGPALRSFVAMSWVVFYRVDGDTIRIVRIVHGARDFDKIDI